MIKTIAYLELTVDLRYNALSLLSLGVYEFTRILTHNNAIFILFCHCSFIMNLTLLIVVGLDGLIYILFINNLSSLNEHMGGTQMFSCLLGIAPLVFLLLSFHDQRLNILL